MDPLLNSTIAKTGAWNFLYILIWSIKYIYICLISFILSSFFLLPFAFSPSLLHFLVYLGPPAVSFIHSLFFPFLLSLKYSPLQNTAVKMNIYILQNFAVGDSCTYFGQFRMFPEKICTHKKYFWYHQWVLYFYIYMFFSCTLMSWADRMPFLLRTCPE